VNTSDPHRDLHSSHWARTLLILVLAFALASILYSQLPGVFRSGKRISAAPSPSAPVSRSGLVYYVNPSGSDSNSGSRECPFQTIQRAADVVSPGDTVIVQDGVYTAKDGDTAVVSLNRGGTTDAFVTFKSENRWGAKLDGLRNTAASGFRFLDSANYIQIEGFELYGFGNSKRGGAAAFELFKGGHDTAILFNHIHDIGRLCTDTTNGQVGVFIQQSQVRLEGNRIHDIGRLAPDEQGCHPTQPYFMNHDHGIYVDKVSDVSVQNNVFYNINRGWAIQLFPGPSNRIKIYNNTFVFKNPYKAGQIVVAASGADNEIVNNIFYDPLAAGIYFYEGVQNNMTVSHNLVYNGAIAQGNSSGVKFLANIDSRTASIFSDLTHFDFRLSGNSPARDAGIAIPSVHVDLDGIVRPQGRSYDIGAYELH